MSESANNLNPRPGRRGWRVLSVLLGTLLLVTAGLKFVSPSVAAYDSVPVLGTPVIQQIGVLAELTLGIWLLSGWYPWLAWLSALVVFMLFSVISGHQ